MSVPELEPNNLVFCYQNCSKLLWEKIVPVIKKKFWNLTLKAEYLQNVWDHWRNLFKQWKVRTIFGNSTDTNIFDDSYKLVTNFPEFPLWENRIAYLK